jgi:hypothetical protein
MPAMPAKCPRGRALWDEDRAPTCVSGGFHFDTHIYIYIYRGGDCQITERSSCGSRWGRSSARQIALARVPTLPSPASGERAPFQTRASRLGISAGPTPWPAISDSNFCVQRRKIHLFEKSPKCGFAGADAYHCLSRRANRSCRNRRTRAANRCCRNRTAPLPH